MSIQKLHALEKTSVQLRHSIKRLEVFIELTKDEGDKLIAEQMLEKFRELRRMIPTEYRDVDLRDKAN